ncbi:DUF4173 domain-containing protein [Gymnodinialimonas sp. 2305UL16-5]|uniref:DUF4153 domain-containing protein n=1 Tax=Gymnodinialimonas mytili TaxID=3126503 RepID=UPI00309CDB04
MRGEWVVRGVPESIRNDGWWLSEPVVGKARARNWRDAARQPLGAVILLVAMADWLFWNDYNGISVAVFALALSVAIIAFKPGGATRREWAWAMAFAVACNLPMIEHAQTLSALFTLLGLIILLLWSAENRVLSAAEAARIWFRASTVGAVELPRHAAEQLNNRRSGWDIGALLRQIALPGSIGLVFLVLIGIANPLVENGLNQITRIDLIGPDLLVRVAFWIVAAALIWPYLNTRGPWRGKAPTEPQTSLSLGPLAQIVNPQSVRASLILFNLLFLVQTLSDIGVLSGGLTLPEGMTYAEYAHRGAYPLMLAAILAGGFVIGTRQMVTDNRVMRGLIYLWLGQTLFLVITAGIRLGLYVDAYTLTYLRVAAFIWMALIYVGLVLTLAFIAQKRAIAWLIRWNAVTLLGTLYLCCFVNFAYLITDYNMAKAEDIEALDLSYLCQLGEQAIPAMMEYGQITDNVTCGRNGLPSLRFDAIEDWREWGFRRWRLQRYLESYHDL